MSVATTGIYPLTNAKFTEIYAEKSKLLQVCWIIYQIIILDFLFTLCQGE